MKQTLKDQVRRTTDLRFHLLAAQKKEVMKQALKDQVNKIRNAEGFATQNAELGNERAIEKYQRQAELEYQKFCEMVDAL